MGQEVFLISESGYRRYYHFCYLRREDAEIVRDRLEATPSGEVKTLIDFNFKADPELSMHVRGPVD